MKNNFSHDDSQKGFAFIAIILVVVVIFSIALVSGAQEFQYSVETPPPPKTTTPTPTAGGANPTPTATPPSAGSNWNLTIQTNDCQNSTTKGNYKNAQITAVGQSNGYIAISVQREGNLVPLATAAFTPANKNYTVSLLNDLGFNSSSWQVTIYSGGVQGASGWTGGNVMQTYSGTPTGCS